MRNPINAFAAVALLTAIAPFSANAGGTNPTADADHGFAVLSVIGAAYHDRSVATNGAEVHRQGGFAVAGATQWPSVSPDASGSDRAFSVPPVVGASLHDPQVALNEAEVRRQGGFTTAGAVTWLPAARTDTGVKVEAAAFGTR